MKTRISEFVRLVGMYLSRDAIHTTTVEQAARSDLDRTTDIADAWNHRQDAMAAVRTLGRTLTEEMEAKGEDASCVLRVLNAMDGGGGANRVREIWEDAKVALQRVAIRQTLPCSPPVAAKTKTSHAQPIDWIALITRIPNTVPIGSQADLARYLKKHRSSVTNALKKPAVMKAFRMRFPDAPIDAEHTPPRQKSRRIAGQRMRSDVALDE